MEEIAPARYRGKADSGSLSGDGGGGGSSRRHKNSSWNKKRLRILVVHDFDLKSSARLAESSLLSSNNIRSQRNRNRPGDPLMTKSVDLCIAVNCSASSSTSSGNGCINVPEGHYDPSDEILPYYQGQPRRSRMLKTVIPQPCSPYSYTYTYNGTEVGHLRGRARIGKNTSSSSFRAIPVPVPLPPASQPIFYGTTEAGIDNITDDDYDDDDYRNGNNNDGDISRQSLRPPTTNTSNSSRISPEERAARRGLITAALSQLESIVCRVVYLLKDEPNSDSHISNANTDGSRYVHRRLTSNSLDIRNRWLPLVDGLGVAGIVEETEGLVLPTDQSSSSSSSASPPALVVPSDQFSSSSSSSASTSASASPPAFASESDSDSYSEFENVVPPWFPSNQERDRKLEPRLHRDSPVVSLGDKELRAEKNASPKSDDDGSDNGDSSSNYDRLLEGMLQSAYSLRTPDRETNDHPDDEDSFPQEQEIPRFQSIVVTTASVSATRMAPSTMMDVKSETCQVTVEEKGESEASSSAPRDSYKQQNTVDSSDFVNDHLLLEIAAGAEVTSHNSSTSTSTRVVPGSLRSRGEFCLVDLVLDDGDNDDDSGIDCDRKSGSASPPSSNSRRWRVEKTHLYTLDSKEYTLDWT